MSSVAKTKMRMNAKATRKGKVHHTAHRNQLEQPLNHDLGVEKEKVKFFFKSKQGQATILFTDQLTYLECECLEMYINRWLKRKHVTLNGTFICTGKKGGKR